MFDITNVMEAIIYLVCILVSTFIIPLVKSKTTAAQQEEINNWIKIAVTAAEQIYVGSGRGEEKKQYVISWLAQRNIKYDSSKIDAMIEAAVYALKNDGALVNNKQSNLL